jgi:hypothetical protein
MPQSTKVMNASPETVASAGEKLIRAFVIKRRACFERWNEFEMVNGIRTHTGYCLRLCGINERIGDERAAGGHHVPGCAFCRRTYGDLRRIAKWILPKDARKSEYKIEPFDYAFHIAPPARGFREEIVVTIQIPRRYNPRLPADECENQYLKEMCGRLKDLGVLEGRVKDGCGKTRW